MSLRQTAALWAGRATARLPISAHQVLWRVLRLGKTQPIYRLTGQTLAGTPGAMIAAGIGPASAYIPHLFFTDQPSEELISTVPILKFRRELERLQPTVDLTVARMDSLLARALFPPDYLRVPEWVRSTASLPKSIETLGNQSRSLRRDLRRIREHQFQPFESHLESDLREFYETMFRPHSIGRHGSATYLKSFEEIRHLWRAGCLLWVMRNGERLGGIAAFIKHDTLFLFALGVRNGSETLLREGVLSAAYLFAFEYARKKGARWIDFGATRPSLTDGLLSYKRKWGAILHPKSSNPARLLIRWTVTTPAITAMLNRSPLVFVEDGKLAAIQGEGVEIPVENKRGLHRTYYAPAGEKMTRIALT